MSKKGIRQAAANPLEGKDAGRPIFASAKTNVIEQAKPENLRTHSGRKNPEPLTLQQQRRLQQERMRRLLSRPQDMGLPAAQTPQDIAVPPKPLSVAKAAKKYGYTHAEQNGMIRTCRNDS